MKRNISVIISLFVSIFVLTLSSCDNSKSDSPTPNKTNINFNQSDQVKGLEVEHRNGQTFLIWDECRPTIQTFEITQGEFENKMQNAPEKIKYRIYRKNSPITSINNLEPIREIYSSSCWNSTIYATHRSADKSKSLKRFIIKKGDAPLLPGKGLYVYTAKTDQNVYYAVTAVINGVESLDISENNTSNAVNESKEQVEPILQNIETPEHFQYVSNSTIYYYVKWEAPPNSNINGSPHNYIVAVPQNVTFPAAVGVHFHGWGGNMEGGYTWWTDNKDGAILVASNQHPWDWWTGYHEDVIVEREGSREIFEKRPNSQEEWENKRVHPYSQNRINSFIDWMNSSNEWNIDLNKLFVVGNSMGGSGALMLAIRYSSKYAWVRSYVGVHNPDKSPTYKSSYEQVYGPKEYNVLFEDGTKVWDYYNDIWYLENNRDKDIGFITFSNGKNDHGIGWEQAVDFINKLQETKQPHLFIWGQAGHGQRTVMPKNESQDHMPIDIRLDQTLPAFTDCSLDNNYGNGDTLNGAEEGQVNRYLYWDTNTITDSASKWEMTLALTTTAPESSCTVNVTPRRCQNFKHPTGASLNYEVKDLSGNILNSGTIIVDQYKLFTIPNITVTVDKVVLSITK